VDLFGISPVLDRAERYDSVKASHILGGPQMFEKTKKTLATIITSIALATGASACAPQSALFKETSPYRSHLEEKYEMQFEGDVIKAQPPKEVYDNEEGSPEGYKFRVDEDSKFRNEDWSLNFSKPQHGYDVNMAAEGDLLAVAILRSGKANLEGKYTHDELRAKLSGSFSKAQYRTLWEQVLADADTNGSKRISKGEALDLYKREVQDYLRE